MNGKRPALFTLCAVCLLAASAAADVGVIIPSNVKDRPDPAILDLRQMQVDVRIDGQYARIRVLQIFRNRTANDVEGKYIFTLPDGGQVSDFAIWEDGTRIPGVIVERRRARQIYEDLTYMKIDPGLLENSGIDERNYFTVQIYPIPSYGTKRVELEYTIDVDIESLRSRFNVPLKPNLYGEQGCGIFDLTFTLDSPFAIRNFRQVGTAMPLALGVNEPQRVKGRFSGSDLSFTEDFAIEYDIDIPGSLLTFLTYRNTAEQVDLGPIDGGSRIVDTNGYFAAQAVFNQRGGAANHGPRDVVLMVDTSLSMQWDKLEKTHETLEYFLKNLPAADRFGLVTFNEDVRVFDKTLRPSGNENAAAALAFFRGGSLMGGTDIVGAVEKTLALFGKPDGDRERYIILITDGAPTLRELGYGRIAERVKAANAAGVSLMVFGIGADTNRTLLQRLADESGGYFVSASETEDFSFKLSTFLDKLGEKMVSGLGILFSRPDNFYSVYATSRGAAWDRSLVSYLGRYKAPGSAVDVTISGDDSGRPVKLTQRMELPETATEHDQLPRRWAKLRVDHLLEQIELNPDSPESEKMINEVIGLAKRFKFVTPYTSFLAAPRALLRPRAIRPGDPVLRVRTIEGIVSVVAIFPFGLTKPLHYIADEDVWETRFLAPKEMRDGAYRCSLVLTDSEGNLYQEEKDFVIDSRPPELQVRTDQERYAPGAEVKVFVNADADTRSIQVRIGELLPAEARYRTASGASEAAIRLPQAMPPGTYTLKVTAVDFARNTTTIERRIVVASR